ncbi:IS3 family transposase, partial [Nocardia takedensis]|uniref:IS3 family transposase n=1 Tax=Nocardia takedensis TaxID=259390 RepID=UPI0009FDEFA5
RRAAVAHLQRLFGMSQRLACRVTGQHRSTQRRPRAGQAVTDPDAGLRAWLRDWAKSHPRQGFRRAYHEARGEGWSVNHKKIQRLWREEGLRVPQRRRRKRLGDSTVTTLSADAPNRVWAVDFQFDATDDGRPVKIVSIVDEHTRECLGGLVERSITADRLIDELDRIAARRGYPAALRCDNGPELACSAMADWAGERVGLAFIPPGQPWRNGYIESFNGRLRDECLNINSFWSITQARVVISDWKADYNYHRRHSALGYRTPAGYAAICTHR